MMGGRIGKSQSGKISGISMNEGFHPEIVLMQSGNRYANGDKLGGKSGLFHVENKGERVGIARSF